jgi:hypothetical protein
MIKTKNKKCEGGNFAMSMKTHLQGCGCPECAKEENISSKDEFLQSALNCLKILLQEERIIVFDPKSRKCLSGPDLEHVCINGNSIQIGLSDNWQND